MSLSAGRLAPRILRPKMGRSGSGVSAASAAALLVSDTFTDTNFTELTAHTPDTDVVGGGWSVAVLNAAGTIQIGSNEARALWDSGGTLVVVGHIDSGQADVTVSADITFSITSAFGSQGLLFRLVDSSNYWSAEREASSGDFRLIETSAGVETERASSAAGIAALSTVTIEAVLSGNSITATVDGGNEINFTSSTHASATSHGFTGVDLDGDQETRFDNFTVTT